MELNFYKFIGLLCFFVAHLFVHFGGKYFAHTSYQFLLFAYHYFEILNVLWHSVLSKMLYSENRSVKFSPPAMVKIFWSNMKVKSLCHVRLFATPWTVALQAPPSMGFSRQEYWSGFPFPPPGIFLTQGLNSGLLHCRQTLLSESPGKSNMFRKCFIL